MVIAIPSYRRADSIFDNTLCSILAAGVDMKDVTVFLSDPAERPQYEKAIGGLVNIVDSKPTKSGNITFILNYYPKGEQIIFIDDDVKSFKKLDLSGKKLMQANLKHVAELGFKLCLERGKTMWGVYPAANAFFMKPRTAEGLLFAVGSCFGIINTGASYHIVKEDEKDDYRRTFQCFENEGGVIRLEHVTVNTSYYKTPGGMQSFRTKKIIEDGAKRLAEQYPQYCSAYKNDTKDTWELRLNNHKYKTVEINKAY